MKFKDTAIARLANSWPHKIIKDPGSSYLVLIHPWASSPCVYKLVAMILKIIPIQIMFSRTVPSIKSFKNLFFLKKKPFPLPHNSLGRTISHDHSYTNHCQGDWDRYGWLQLIGYTPESKWGMTTQTKLEFCPPGQRGKGHWVGSKQEHKAQWGSGYRGEHPVERLKNSFIKRVALGIGPGGFKDF